MSSASAFVRMFARISFICALVGMLSCVLQAQQNYGTILGTVTDTTGAVLTGAKITVTNTATHLTRETTTEKDGSFRVLSLPIGTYTVNSSGNFTFTVGP